MRILLKAAALTASFSCYISTSWGQTPQQLAADNAAVECDRLAAHRVLGPVTANPTAGSAPDFSAGPNNRRAVPRQSEPDYCAWCNAISTNRNGDYYKEPPPEVYSAQIKIPEAVRACELAVQLLPLLPIREAAKARYYHQLARAYVAAEEYPKALDAYKKAAALGYRPAMAQVAVMLAFPRDGSTPKDPTTAIQFAQEAVKNGDRAVSGYGYFALGLLHLYGVGVPQNATIANELLRKAASYGVPEAAGTIAEGINRKSIPGTLQEAVRWGQQAGEDGRVLAFFEAALAAASLGQFDTADNLMRKASGSRSLVSPYQQKLFDERLKQVQADIERMKQNAAKLVESIANSLIYSSLQNDSLAGVTAVPSSAPAREVDKWGTDSFDAVWALLEKVEKTSQSDPLKLIVTTLNVSFSPAVLSISDPYLRLLIESHKELLESKQFDQQDVWVHPCIVVKTYSAKKSKALRRRLNNSLAPNQLVAVRQVWVYGLSANALDRVERKELTKEVSGISGAQFGIMVDMVGMTDEKGEVVFSRARTDAGTQESSPAQIQLLTIPASVQSAKIQATLESLKGSCPAGWKS